eukprot:TRINITY_DN7649_c0_g2_i2.p1 TRINITY_DN7649_c0_g2~~TRINITY_DN7649_c0_g2_i2.p1  ORF type:complete len:137 (-),score=16.78 TRINITY_DN7649_c0_g2_i2:106-516(-)
MANDLNKFQERWDAMRAVTIIFIIAGAYYLLMMILKLIFSKGREAGYDYKFGYIQKVIYALDITFDLFLPFLGVVFFVIAIGECYTFCAIMAWVYIFWVFIVHGLKLTGGNERCAKFLRLGQYLFIIALFVNYFVA